jgi:uncharacterized protein YceK
MKKLLLVFGVLMVTGLCAQPQGVTPGKPGYKTSKPSAVQTDNSAGKSAQPAVGSEEVQQIYIGF